MKSTNKDTSLVKSNTSKLSLEDQISKFLVSGGKIEQVDRGVSAPRVTTGKIDIVITPPSDISRVKLRKP